MQSVVDLATLIASANEIEVDDGERLEAVLCQYTDIEDYRKALAEFHASGGQFTQASVSVRCRLDGLGILNVHILFSEGNLELLHREENLIFFMLQILMNITGRL
jgi:hypothetical protein